MKRRNKASWSRIWMRWFSWSVVRILHWLSVDMPHGSNDPFVKEKGPVYLKQSLPAALITITAQAALSATQISKFLFSQRYCSPPDEYIGWRSESHWILCFQQSQWNAPLLFGHLFCQRNHYQNHYHRHNVCHQRKNSKQLKHPNLTVW